jgi:iron complex outermembrane receptor protein
MRKKLIAGVLTALLSVAPVYAQGSQRDDSLGDLAKLSFEDLSNVVTSVSKRPEDPFRAPAAIYVITQDDIKHSGHRSIPELLRMVPGLQVAQSDPAVWAITSRGFNSDGFGNKLLVLIDGRTVYTPLFSGVYWDVQDVMLEDIERIEIIRGPGATLWGANAVNGVINIITKQAKDTQTTVISGGVGTETTAFGEARYGGRIGDKGFYRLYTKRFDNDSSKTVLNTDGGNSWNSNRAGFRADMNIGDSSAMTVQGDIYDNHQNLGLYLPDFTFRDDKLRAAGGNFLATLDTTHDSGAQSSLKMYYDVASSHYSLLAQDNYTFDTEYQYLVPLNDRNTLITGVGYRFITDELRGSSLISYTPTSRDRNLYSAFIQDTYKLVPDLIDVTIGSKLEHNDFTGFEVQPGARISYYPTDNQTLWASVSRAVRTPNRSEDDLSLVVLPGYIRWLGSRAFESEELIAYETGYRIHPVQQLTLDITGFVNDYDNLRTNEVTFDGLPSDTIVGLEFANNAKATSYGFEVSADWNVTSYWTLKGSYSFLQMDIHPTNDSTDSVAEDAEGISPKNQFSLHSQLYLPHDIEFSNSLYYVDNLGALDVPAYFRFDSRIGWKPVQNIELSLVGQNLLDDNHQEFSGPLHGIETEIGRNVYGMVTVRF